METNDDKFYSIDGLAPSYHVHPGEILGEELKERGISQKTFAEKIGIQPSHLCALIHGARSFTPSVSAKIESGLPGVSADYWMRMQESYNALVETAKAAGVVFVDVDKQSFIDKAAIAAKEMDGVLWSAGLYDKIAAIGL